MEMDYETFLAEWRDESRDTVTCHTSGSTGVPKEILLPKEMMAESAMRTISHFSLDSSSHLHSCISPEYIGGKMMAVRSELTGATLSWERPSNRPLAEYNGPGIDLLALVPSQLAGLLDNDGPLPRIGAIIVGGAPVLPSLRMRVAHSGLNVWETYGMTETASHIALRKVTEPESPFTLLSGIEIDTDSRGCLVIDMGRWGLFHTNDVARISCDRQFTICGRDDNVIISGGKKVHPEEVEALVEALTGLEVLVSGEPDEKWGERVVMTVEPVPDDAEISDAGMLMQFCHRHLRPECVPKAIRFGKIARTANGKKKRGTNIMN